MILVVGGARSGKSSFAENLVKELSGIEQKPVLYIATSIAFDDDMKFRIQKHRESRPSHWKTLEKYKGFASLSDEKDFCESDIILVDCMTLMVSNLMIEEPVDYDQIGYDQITEIEKMIQEEVKALLENCQKAHKKLVIVSNEVGLGVVPPYRLGTIFRDIAGRVNQNLAKMAQEVYILHVGIPQKIKG